MSRTQRVLDLIQNLRGRRYAVPGRVLAEELGISLRSLYRDIAALKGQGVPVDGDPGVGYLLRPGFTLPPLMFTPDELEALVLGARWVVDRAGGLGQAARDALVKIGAVIPGALKDDLGSSPLLIPSQSRPPVADALVRGLRQAVGDGQKVELTYRDLADRVTRRTVWPFALAFYDQVLVVVSWCETRQDFRHFRLDRVEAWALPGEGYPRSRSELLTQWREKYSIRPDWTADTF